jgi:hypothetical protein
MGRPRSTRRFPQRLGTKESRPKLGLLNPQRGSALTHGPPVREGEGCAGVVLEGWP